MFCISLKDYFCRQFIRTIFFNYEVENEILDRGCYGFLSPTYVDDQNELLKKTFELT